ncbi:hypothetical protein Bca52824_064146 [Brassica carinata]|uniref:Uncharacterized protein n=1 Tax=Brassica carinata TaxID=52824 RepID=A0A8X7QFS5_BRACI|nr:hypothetical protein Bca52824_064146 [Brassica carinata]
MEVHPPSYTDILSVEAEPDLEVTSSIPILSQPVPGWGVWPDASNDERVSYMEQLIADHRPLKKEFWHGGDTSVTIIDEPALTKFLKPRKTSKQRETVLKSRKTARKTDTVRKQRRISNYFHAASSSRTSDDKILELLSGISEQLSNIQKEQKLFRIVLKRQSTPSRLKRSAFRNRSNIFTAKETVTFLFFYLLMEEDHTFSHSPVVSQYSAQKYGSTALNKEPSSKTAMRNRGTTPVHTSIHASPSTNLRPAPPDHEVSDHNIPTPNSPFTPKDTPIHPPKTIKTRRSAMPPINAFSETATSSPFSVANSSLPNLKDQPAEENDVCELSDSSSARERPKHIPSVKENILAKELYRSESVPALDLICPLNQSLWDRFEICISLTPFVHRFHITPSKFDFSNNFLLQLAKPSQWTTTYHMEILMYMLAARHSRLLEEQKLAFITTHLTSGIQAISKNFMKSRKRETFQWDEKVTEIVLQPGKKWMEDVITALHTDDMG